MGTDLIVSASPINLLDGNWHHIAATFDGTTRSIYVDGILKGSDNPGSSHTVPAMNVRIGSTCTLCGGEYFNGGIDEVRIWNVGRTQCDVISYMNCEIPSSETGLVANYHFNQGFDGTNNPTVTTLTDVSGNSNSGTLTNFALTGATSNWIAPGGVVSGFTTTTVCTPAAALNFDGVDDNVNLGNSINTILDPLNKITVEAWVNPSTTNGLGVIAGNYNTSGPGMQFLLRRDFDQYAFWVDDGSGFKVVNSGVSSVVIGSWQHVSGVWDGSQLLIYINGILNGTTGGVTGPSFVSSGNSVSIGYNSINENFTGTIDETRIWTIARTQCEINTYMNCEIPSSSVGLIANYHFNQGVASANNGFETTLMDASGNSNNGTLSNFVLTGATSNWVAPSAVANGYTVTTITLPTITASASSSIVCAGNATTLIGAGATTYSWTGSVIDNTTFTPVSTDTYTVTGTDANGCFGTATQMIIVNSLPTITVNSGVICVGQSFTMTPNGAVTYTYSNGSNIGMPTSDATYTVIGTDANGCENNAVASVTVNALPTITVNNEVICAGQSYTMAPNGAVTYTYSNGSNVAMPTSDATYTVSGTDANGCENMATSTVTVNALPVLSATSTSTLMCTGETATLSVTGASTYTWSTTETTAIIAVTPTTQTTYTVDGTDANGCMNTTTITQDVSLCTGIVSNSLINSQLVSIYPNPSNGIFSVKSDTDLQLNLTNALGQVMQTIQLNESNNHQMNVDILSNGIYFIIGQNGNQSVKQKVIVTK